MNDRQQRIALTRIVALEVEHEPVRIDRCEGYLAMGMVFTVAPVYSRNEVYAHLQKMAQDVLPLISLQLNVKVQ